MRVGQPAFCANAATGSEAMGSHLQRVSPMDTSLLAALNARRNLTRRDLLRHFANGFGMVAFAGLLADQAKAAAPANPLAVKPPMYAAKAKRLIFLFMSGGPSHVD